MLTWPSMLLIGAAARNVGKTEFACRMLKRFAAAQTPAIGVKITVVREESGGCPRGGAGCGVCGSLTEPFTITFEENAPSAKDTGRMVAAGASKVFWLRVKSAHLNEGVNVLKAMIDPSVPVVAESNSARLALEPGLFLIIQTDADESVKKSCKAVMHFDHVPVLFKGTGWDINPDDIVFVNKTWAEKLSATAVILAGGKSSRMGTDKSLLPINGIPMIKYIADQLQPVFKEVIISSNDPDKFAFLSLPVVRDKTPDCGPIMGIYSALAAAAHTRVFVTGCDIPVMHQAFIREMYELAGNHAIVMPKSGDAFEPLYAFYQKKSLPAFEQALKNSQRRVVAVLEHCQAVHPAMPAGSWYVNLNTIEDYRAQLDIV